MPRPTKIDRLPAAIRELIHDLRRNGRHIDEILAKLRELDVSIARSTLGEHIQKLDVIGAKMHEIRAISEALIARFGDAPESKTARLNIELMQGQLMKLATGEQLEPREAQFVSDSLYKLAKAAKDDLEREVKLRKLIKDKAAAAVARVGKAEGLSAATIKKFRREILGIGQS